MILSLYKNIESISTNELEEISKLDKDMTFSYFADPFTFDIGIVKNRDQIIGAGIIRVVNELKMILNQDLSKTTKAKVLKLLMNKAIKLRQCKELLVTLTLPEDYKDLARYAKILRDHYKFWEDDSVLMRREF